MGKIALEVVSGFMGGMGYSLNLKNCDLKVKSDMQAFKHVECFKIKV